LDSNADDQTLPSFSRTYRLIDRPRRLPRIRHIPDEVDTVQLDEVFIKSHVGGLVKSFERKVA
jgi:hypothetical protein